MGLALSHFIYTISNNKNNKHKDYHENCSYIISNSNYFDDTFQFQKYYDNYNTSHINLADLKSKKILNHSNSFMPQDYFKYYKLYLYIDSSLSQQIKDIYINNANKHNSIIDSYFIALSSDNLPDNKQLCFDAGFDLICPEDTVTCSKLKTVLDHKVKCSMKVCQSQFFEKYVGYYLYSRSSTASKTPLRLANSVGIIDSGYRGNIKAVFDNIDNTDFMQFNLEFGNRYAQICPPNLEYPMKVYIVDDISLLGYTDRGTGGFGSTGK